MPFWIDTSICMYMVEANIDDDVSETGHETHDSLTEDFASTG